MRISKEFNHLIGPGTASMSISMLSGKGYTAAGSAAHRPYFNKERRCPGLNSLCG